MDTGFGEGAHMAREKPNGVIGRRKHVLVRLVQRCLDGAMKCVHSVRPQEGYLQYEVESAHVQS